MLKRVAVVAVGLLALCPIVAHAAAYPNPFVPPPQVAPPPPPPPPQQITMQEVEALVRRIVEEALKRNPPPPPPEKKERVPDPDPDRTVGAKLITCLNGQGIWREILHDSAKKGDDDTIKDNDRLTSQLLHVEEASGKTGSGGGSSNLGVIFHATPRPPLRNPCAR